MIDSAASHALPEAEQPQAYREGHLERIPSDNALGQFSIQQVKPSEADVFRLLAAARKARESALLARLGENFPGPEAAKLLAAMAAHGEVEADQAHVLLAEMPLIRLVDLERPAWTVLTGQRFRQTTSRRDERSQWLKRAFAKDKPVLLVVDAVQPVPASSRLVFDKVPWPPKSSTVKNLLPKVELSQLSQAELAALICDAKLPDISYSGSRPPRFVVLISAAGDRKWFRRMKATPDWVESWRMRSNLFMTNRGLNYLKEQANESSRFMEWRPGGKRRTLRADTCYW